MYDVRDDGLFAGSEFGLYFLGFAIFWTTAWILIHRYVRGMPPDRRRNWRAGAVVGGILVAVGSIVVAGTTYPLARDQWLCREWLEAGEFQTAAGDVTALRREAGKYPPYHFRVGGTDFSYRPINATVGGFQGEFTAPGSERSKFRDGLPVRVAHRDGRILRIEVGE